MKEPYFSHDQNARNDPKIVKIRTKYGIEGYGCYFALLELLSSEREHALEYSEDQINAIAYDLHVSFDLAGFIDRCIEVGLFVSDGKRFWSESFNRRLEEVVAKAAERSGRAAKAAEARWNKARTSGEQCAGNAQAMLEHGSINEETPAGDGIYDQEWCRVVQSYEANIGLFPTGIAGDVLSGYYQDMGANVMCVAIEATALQHPDSPKRYLDAVLKKWLAQGIKTEQQARACVLDHDRVAQARKQDDEKKPDSQPAIRGKFY